MVTEEGGALDRVPRRVGVGDRPRRARAVASCL